MNNQLLRLKAQNLRAKGKTYREIQKILQVKIPKSTLSYWCEDISLPAWYGDKLRNINKTHLQRIRKLALITNKKIREEYLSSLLKRNIHLLKKLDIPIQKLILSILYLGEGAKYKSTQVLTLGNSNPTIIKFYLTLLKNCYNIDEEKIRARVQCRFDQKVKTLERFWQNLTQIKSKQFYPSYLDKRTEGKPTQKKDYKGVCTIYYFSTEIQLELELLASSVMEYFLKGPLA